MVYTSDSQPNLKKEEDFAKTTEISFKLKDESKISNQHYLSSLLAPTPAQAPASGASGGKNALYIGNILQENLT